MRILPNYASCQKSWKELKLSTVSERTVKLQRLETIHIQHYSGKLLSQRQTSFLYLPIRLKIDSIYRLAFSTKITLSAIVVFRFLTRPSIILALFRRPCTWLGSVSYTHLTLP